MVLRPRRNSDDDDDESDRVASAPPPPAAPMPVPVDVQSLPGWLRAAVFLGVPSVIALFLVYVLTTQISERVNKIEMTQQLNQQTIQLLVKGQADRQADANETRRHFDAAAIEIIQSIRRLCVNVAETPQERATCLARGGVGDQPPW